LREIVASLDGVVPQFLFDDKGCVLIAVWGTTIPTESHHYLQAINDDDIGVPGAAHADDVYRAVTCAMKMHPAMRKLSALATIGQPLFFFLSLSS
jgi:hypothetical protein